MRRPWKIWGALLNGGCCVLNDLGPLDPGVLRQLIGERGADSAWLTASLFNTLVDLDPDCLGGLRQLLTGGDILSVPPCAGRCCGIRDCTW